MNKTKTSECHESQPAPAGVAAQSKRCDEAFKRQAVEHWLKSDNPGTQIAAELGLSYPSLKEWKCR